MPVLTPQERVGTLVAEKYRVLRLLGDGGMGVVCEGQHEWTGRRVAIKFLHAELGHREDVGQRFLREARTAASLDHPNVVDVLDMGRCDDGAYFLVLEFLRGRSLEEVLDERGRLDSNETLRILLPILDALALAHEQGIVHRDLKPENIFLAVGHDRKVVPKLLDFGLAKLVDGVRSTKSGVVMGTPLYMSPEQGRGDPELGTASDVWSMGAVIFECLTGRTPAEGENLQAILTCLLTEGVKRVRDVWPQAPEALARAVDSTLAEDPDQRPSVSRLANDLRAAVQMSSESDQISLFEDLTVAEDAGPGVGRGSQSSTQPELPAELSRPPRLGRSRARVHLGVASVAALVVGAVGATVYLSSVAPPPPNVPLVSAPPDPPSADDASLGRAPSPTAAQSDSPPVGPSALARAEEREEREERARPVSDSSARPAARGPRVRGRRGRRSPRRRELEPPVASGIEVSPGANGSVILR